MHGGGESLFTSNGLTKKTSVSHQLFWYAMEKLGEMVSIIQDMYEESSFKVLGENSETFLKVVM